MNARDKLKERSPKEMSLEDIQYHLYVLQKVQRGLDDVREGQVYTQAEMEERFCTHKARPKTSTHDQGSN